MKPTSSKKPKLAVNECKICDAPASYSYFGVISCHSCKMFFKRNAERGQQALKCKLNNSCEINMTNRHVCSSCRLTKCFTIGMQIEMLRSSQSKTKKKNQTKKTTISIKSDEDKQFPTLNILRSDRSTLNIDQWNLLSCLVHCYDEYKGVLLTEHFLGEQNTLPIKLRFKYASVRKFVASLIRENRLLFEQNPDFVSLCPQDRSTLLHCSIKYTTILTASFIGRQTSLLNYPGFLQSIEVLVGSTTTTLIKRLVDQLDFDITFIKLILSILSFSTTRYTNYTNIVSNNLINSETMIQLHDAYIELAWRYLLYKYDYHQTVIYFSRLVSCLFTLDTILMEVYEEKSFTKVTDSVVEQTKRIFDHTS